MPEEFTPEENSVESPTDTPAVPENDVAPEENSVESPTDNPAASEQQAVADDPAVSKKRTVSGISRRWRTLQKSIPV